MKFGLDDITLYTSTAFAVGSPEFYEEMALLNYVCDLFLQKMNGYKPPGIRRITIQPEYHGEWLRPWKSGSIASVAPYFNYEEFTALDREKKYRYVLEVVHLGTMAAGKEFGWDITVFENAYAQVLDADFKFKVEYPVKPSRNRKRTGQLIVEKTARVTSAFLRIESGGAVITRK